MKKKDRDLEAELKAIHEMRALRPLEGHIRRLVYHGYHGFSLGQIYAENGVWGIETTFKGKREFFPSLVDFESFCAKRSIPLLPPGTPKSVRLKNE
jgi:hypothetical protein